MKGILVFDVPDCCVFCPLYNDVWDICTAVDIEIDDNMKMPEWCPIKTEKEVICAIEKDTAKKVIIKPWEPCKCPTCDKELSESVGDGYYKHYYYLKRCPECGQRLDWGD